MQSSTWISFLFMLGACSTTTTSPGEEAAGVPNEACIHGPVGMIAPAHADVGVPESSLTDWVSYSDAVIVMSVLRETMGAPGQLYTGRFISVRIEQIVWEPSSGSSKLQEGAELPLGVLGWSRSGDALQAEGSIRWTVGETYFTPVGKFDDGWAPLTPFSGIPTDGDRLESEMCMQELDAVHPLGDLLLGNTVSDAAQLLEEAPRDPAAERFRHLSPTQRYAAASSAQ